MNFRVLHLVWVRNGWNFEFLPEDHELGHMVVFVNRGRQKICGQEESMMRKPDVWMPYAQKNPHHVVFP